MGEVQKGVRWECQSYDLQEKKFVGNGSPVIGLCAFTVESPGLIPGLGNKTP